MNAYSSFAYLSAEYHLPLHAGLNLDSPSCSLTPDHHLDLVRFSQHGVRPATPRAARERREAGEQRRRPGRCEFVE